jgi:hypothetical protein
MAVYHADGTFLSMPFSAIVQCTLSHGCCVIAMAARALVNVPIGEHLSIVIIDAAGGRSSPLALCEFPPRCTCVCMRVVCKHMHNLLVSGDANARSWEQIVQV